MLNRTANRPLVDVLQLSFQPLNERLCDEELWNVSSDGDDTIKLYWDKPPNDEGKAVVQYTHSMHVQALSRKPACSVS